MKQFSFLVFCLNIWAFAAQAESIGFSLSESATASDPKAIEVRVLDDLTLSPIADAAVIVTASSDFDFANGSKAQTSNLGSVRVTTGFASAKTITVSKEGYAGITVVGVKSSQITLYLKPFPPESKDSVASGQMTGWQRFDRSDTVYSGFVFRALTAFDLLHMDANSLVSPLKDTIDVFGPREIPSNLVLPPQDVSYLFATIHLDKPTYRLPLAPGREVNLAGVHTEIAVKDLVSSGGKVNIELLNKLKFTRVGVTETLVPAADLRQDVNVWVSLIPTHQVIVNPPPFAADVISAAVTDLNGDRQTLIPTDIKVGVHADKPGSVRPVTLASGKEVFGKEKDVVTLAIGSQADRISGIVNTQVGQTLRPGEFLTTETVPDSPALPESVVIRAPLTGVSSALFEAAQSSDPKKSHPTWFVYSLPGAGDVQVPTRILPSPERTRGYSLVQLEFGTDFDEKSIDGRTVMRKLQRFTRSSAKIRN